MDIEDNQSDNPKQQEDLESKRANYLNKNQTQKNSLLNNNTLNNRNSLQGRLSNQSALSFGRMSIEQPSYNQNQKISLQSNISLKAQEKFQNDDLFFNLTQEERNSFNNNLFMRQQGSFKEYQITKQPQNNTNFQIHFPIQNDIGSNNNFGLNFSSQQFKHRSSQGTQHQNGQNYPSNHPLAHNQSQSAIKARQLQNELNIQTKVISSTQNNYSIKEAQIKVEMEQKQKILSCKCPRSKCLLMYCECFSKGIMCNSSCSCYQCRNNPDFQEKRQNARRIVLQRDPNAFSNKLQVVGGEQSSELAYKRGCNCKKTNCFKKYCECFYAGVKCTYLCKCENCMNGGQNAYKG